MATASTLEQRCTAFGDAYGAAPTGDTALRPGVSMAEVRRERTSDTAYDASRAPLERLNYSRIQNIRAQRQETHKEGLVEKQRRGEPINTPTVKPPKNTEGEAVEWPTTFEREGKGGANSGRPSDLDDLADVQYRIRAALFARTRTHYSVLRDKDGGMRITIPKARRAKDGTIPFAERARLADTLGIPAPTHARTVCTSRRTRRGGTRCSRVRTVTLRRRSGRPATP
ncbi:hypothetical protein R1X32_04875 (plasmid) [Rhodococcus opacus]|uniref:hypothetical protein n=1 Tax=Rhodococcus opacus TaxID=37919 RepID=UPI00146F71F3|nr:hypothetical protein HJ581_0042205 [Rhodococcus opacus]